MRIVRLERTDDYSETIHLTPNTKHYIDFSISETYPLDNPHWELKVRAELYLRQDGYPILIECKHRYAEPPPPPDSFYYTHERVSLTLEPELVDKIIATNGNAELKIIGRSQGVQKHIYFKRDQK